jgi:hypothetical protein
MSKREVVVVVRFPAREGMSEEYVIEQWRSLLNGFDGEPTVERIGESRDARLLLPRRSGGREIRGPLE